MTPETRQAIEQQCRYISSDTSIAQHIQILHDRTVTNRDVAKVRAKLQAIRPQGRPPTYGSTGPIVGPSEREFVVKADLRERSDALHFATMKMFDRMARDRGASREAIQQLVLSGADLIAKRLAKAA